MPPPRKILQKSNKIKTYIVIAYCKEIFTYTIQIYIYFDILANFSSLYKKGIIEIWNPYGGIKLKLSTFVDFLYNVIQH